MKALEAYLNQIVSFTNEEMEVFTSLFSVVELKKNEYLALEGEYATRLAFLSTGVIRAFYRNDKGVEYNKTFFFNQGFVGAYSSLVTGNINKINIQCLTPCTLFIADYSQITKLYHTHPKVERLARILAEYFFVSKEKREIELVMLDATKRYRIFQEEHPGLENLIQQYHIASYLGVSPTQLSRIRAKKQK